MKNREWKLFLEDILKSIEQIKKYTKGMDLISFSNNQLVIDAVLKNLQVIGEACKYIPDNVRSNYKQIPWSSIIGLRNIAVHVYYELDMDNIWKIVSDDLPENEIILRSIVR